MEDQSRDLSGMGGAANTPTFGESTSSFGSTTPAFGDSGTPVGTADTAFGTGTAAGGATTSETPSRGEQFAERANQGMQQAAERLDSVAQRIDRLADERLAGTGGRARAGDLAHSAADTMESMANYLRNHDMQSLQQDLERQVRERPLQTLLIGVAAGWIVGKILR